MPQTIAERTIPDIQEGTPTGGGEHIVLLFNDEVHSWDEVIAILQKATGCPYEEAYEETWEAHHTGRSVVHHGDRAECRRAARIIASIGLKVKVEEL